MKKNIYLIFVLMFFLTACSTNLQEDKARDMSKEVNNSKIEIQKNKIDLGEISMKKGKVDIEFTLENTGSDPIVITEGETTCICTSAVLKTKASDQNSEEYEITSRLITMPHGVVSATQIFQIINPGEIATVIATFDPNAHGPAGTGPIKRDVLLTTNSLESPQIDLSFYGTVIK